MYGKISQLLAQQEQRSLLTHHLLWATRNIPGCHSYTIELDLEPSSSWGVPTAINTASADGTASASCVDNPDLIWTHELWDSKEARMAFTSQASSQKAWQNVQSLIADINNMAETTPHYGD